MNNSSFFIVFLCIQYTKANIPKSMNWKYMEALTSDLRRVLTDGILYPYGI